MRKIILLNMIVLAFIFTSNTSFGEEDHASKDWQNVLEKIADLIEDKGISNVLPYNDHDRIRFFVKFWKKIVNKPLWLDKVITRLEKI